jgi:hypothetical protein
MISDREGHVASVAALLSQREGADNEGGEDQREADGGSNEVVGFVRPGNVLMRDAGIGQA